ncbi:MAG: 3-dehydroquinate synthase [Lachnospiraceae bacterium]|nr:3-dehydroquinate synthase [Lachnospiraceae bacterium]
MNKADIVTTYQHEYTTQFIIDTSAEFERLQEMDLRSYDRIFVVIDTQVSSYYKEKLFNRMCDDAKEKITFEVLAEEYSKSIDYYPKLVHFLEEHAAGRYDAVIAIGGGIVIDLVSFTVSTYMRGLPFFIIATTLIGQTDASTAGKTCLNSQRSKNLLGTFFYPKIVYNNIEIMRTNTKRILRQGLSEAFKYSLLTDGKLLDTIVEFQNGEYNNDLMERIVRSTINARIQIRKIDPLASNLGHTFGHALEKYFDYKILHGDAILIGTVMAISYAVEKGLMEQEEYVKIFELMQRAHLNTAISEELDVKRLVEFMRKDKKSSSLKLHLVMIEGIGRPYRGETPFYEADYDDVEIFLERFMDKYPYKQKRYIEFVDREIL